MRNENMIEPLNPQCVQTCVSGSLFSEMNTEMLKISVAIQNIKQSEFIEDYRNHKLTKYFISEEVPQNKPDDIIYKLVGKNFRKEVNNNLHSYIVLYCSKDKKKLCNDAMENF